MHMPPSRATTTRIRFQQIFEELSATFVPHDGYGRDTSPRFWRAVFIAYYDSEPTHDEDPRWEELFSLRYPERRTFNALHT